jgi:hypothetical protein
MVTPVWLMAEPRLTVALVVWVETEVVTLAAQAV